MTYSVTTGWVTIEGMGEREREGEKERERGRERERDRETILIHGPIRCLASRRYYDDTSVIKYQYYVISKCSLSLERETGMGN